MTTIHNDQLLLQRFYSHCATRGTEVFLTQPQGNGVVQDYTFNDVLDQAKRMAAHLLSLELPPWAKIALISKNCAHFFMADLAIWMAGHVSVALYPTLNRDTVSYILTHSDAELLFVGKLDTWDEVQHGIPEGMRQIALPLSPPTNLPKWGDITTSTAPIKNNPVRNADDESIIIYTSGSTGQPKGVLHTFQTICTPTVGLVDILQIKPSDRSLSYLPLAHAMDRWLSECIGLYVGSHIFFAESLDTFVQDLARARSTIFVSVPRLWLKFQLGVFAKIPEKKLNKLLRIPILRGIIKKKILGKLGLDTVRFAGSGSAPIPAELLTWYRNLGLELLEGYGMSENFNYSHITMPGRGRPGFIGHPCPDVTHRLSEQGEILVKSPGNMVGYYKEPELTADAFTEDGFLKTGDRGEIDTDGRLRITGRVKELFKTSKGKYVAPAPIENIINTDSNVELSCVSGSGYPTTHAVVQLAEDLLPKLDEASIREQITGDLATLLARVNGQVEAFEKLGFIVVSGTRWTVEGGHLTPTMKMKRPVIEALHQEQLDAWYADGRKVIWEV